MKCFKCGFANPTDSNYCQKCGNLMPQLSEEFCQQSEQPVTDRLKKIETACEKVRKKEISREEFSRIMSDINGELITKAQEIAEIVQETGYHQDAPQEVEAGFKGIDLFEQGLARMILYLGEENTVYLDEGMDLITQGNESINAAMQLNRQNRQNLDWEVWG